MTTRVSVSSQKLRHIFGALPIREATAPLTIVLKDEDFDKAIPHDRANCVFSCCCRRAFTCSAVAFYRTVAYVDLPDAKGNRAVYRFMTSPDMLEVIHKFDSNGKRFGIGRQYVLLPPTPSQTVAGSRQRSIKQRNLRKENGETYTPKKKGTSHIMSYVRL